MTCGSRLATRMLVLAAVSAFAWAQPLATDRAAGPPIDRRLPFAIERSAGDRPILVLGVNRFTSGQYVRFLAGIDAFLNRARTRARGEQVVWSVDGLRGYVSVSTSPFADGPPYLLTLRGEPVRSFDSDAAMLNTLTLVGYRVLEAERAAPGRVGVGAFPRVPFP